MSDVERLNQIREHLERYQQAVLWDLEREAKLADLYYRYSEDIPFLLAEVERLKSEMRKRDDLLDRMAT